MKTKNRDLKIKNKKIYQINNFMFLDIRLMKVRKYCNHKKYQKA